MWNLTETWFGNDQQRARFDDLLMRAQIVHYVGRRKPWIKEGRWATHIYHANLKDVDS